MAPFCRNCGHDLEHCIDDRRILRYSPWLISKRARKAAPNWVTSFVLKCCKCNTIFFMFFWEQDGWFRPFPDYYDDDDDDDDSCCGALVVSAPTELVYKLYLAALIRHSAIETIMSSMSTFRHPDYFIDHPGDSTCLLCALLLKEDFYQALVGVGPGALHMSPGNAIQGFWSEAEPALDTDFQVFHARVPDQDPRRTQQRYRQKSIMAFRRLYPAIRRAHETAQRLYLLLLHGRNYQPSFLHVVLNVLFAQLADLIHHTYADTTGNIWLADLAFALHRGLARNSVQRTYHDVWVAAWRFGILTGEFPRRCGLNGSEPVRKMWTSMVADGLLGGRVTVDSAHDGEGSDE